MLVRTRRQDERRQPTAGTFDLHVYETTVDQGEHLALVKGDVAAPGPVLVRVHAVNLLGDLLGVGEAGENGQIANSLRMIEQEGRGVVVLIRDLRPKSVSEWISRTPAVGQARRGRA